MSKDSPALQSLPSGAASALRALGSDLATARKRRRQSQREWAQRLNVSVPTLGRMERGDPSVSAGIYATALWLVQRHQALAELARPQEDLAVLEAEVRQAEGRYRREGSRD
jgi:transcriptional regulator with XRE-family HTH domain